MSGSGAYSVSPNYVGVFVCLLSFSFGVLCGLAGWEGEIVGKEVAISTKWTGRV